MTRPIRLASAGCVAAALIAGTALCSPARATPVAFSFNYTVGGGTDQAYAPDGAGTLLSSATTVTEGIDQMILSIDDVSGPPAGALGNLLSYVAAPLSVPLGLSGAMIDQLVVKWDGIYTFTSSSGSYTRNPAQDDLNFEWAGTFTDSSNVLETQPATFTQTWSQSAAGNQPSVGGTFNTEVPEPGTMVLVASGLLGLGLTRRRRGRSAA